MLPAAELILTVEVPAIPTVTASPTVMLLAPAVASVTVAAVISVSTSNAPALVVFKLKVPASLAFEPKSRPLFTAVAKTLPLAASNPGQYLH